MVPWNAVFTFQSLERAHMNSHVRRAKQVGHWTSATSFEPALLLLRGFIDCAMAVLLHPLLEVVAHILDTGLKTA